MAQLVVRKLENTVKERLQRRARRNGHSMEEEVREILRNAVAEKRPSSGGLGTRIAALVSKRGGLKTPIPEFRGHEIKPATFD